MRELLCGIVIGLAVGAPVGAWWCVIMMHYNRKRKRIEMANLANPKRKEARSENQTI